MTRPVQIQTPILLGAVILWCFSCPLGAQAVAPSAEAAARLFVTHAGQFRELSGEDFLAGCDFRLTGAVTLVDTNRDLLVLQDDTGAVALRMPLSGPPPQVGQRVTIDGAQGIPLFSRFPEFPFHPSGADVRDAFETPPRGGTYRLARLRGWLRPPVTGSYRFWIASDNSSELWLGTDAGPETVRRVASVPRFNWVEPREWSRFPSQRSELIPLQAGELYYIEALHEQTTELHHLAVAWEIPSADPSSIEVIDGRHLIPWQGGEGPAPGSPGGILREYWTDYTAGDLTGMGGPRPFASVLSVPTASVRPLGGVALPAPEPISLSRPLPPERNFRWARAEGVLRFHAATEDGGFLELADGASVVQVHVTHEDPVLSGARTNAAVRVEGVCEGIPDGTGTLMPGLLWVSAPGSITLLEGAPADARPGIPPSPPAIPARGRDMQGFYGTRGVVTYHGRVFEKDYIVVQEGAAVVLVNATGRPLATRLQVGQGVDLGGDLNAVGPLPVITPVFVATLGRRAMPRPLFQPRFATDADACEGRWCEIEGVVLAVASNGTLSVASPGGRVEVWLGQTNGDALSCWVDAAVRVRGVLSTTWLDAPTLFVPSRRFFGVEKPPPEDPFALPRHAIADLPGGDREPWRTHRVRVIGRVTYGDADSFFLQDATGGIRVRTPGPSHVAVGQTAEVAAFPVSDRFAPYLAMPVMRPAPAAVDIRATDLDLRDALPSRLRGALVHVDATLLARKTNAVGQVLELQQQQRAFTATLGAHGGELPHILPGSRLRLTGVCDDDLAVSAPAEDARAPEPPRASLNILLRTPGDVAVLHGPPWWTWERTAALVGALLVFSGAALLWAHLLRQRLVRQRTAQRAFSRQVLERLEEERHRIAANLHDSLGQTLLVIKNHAEFALQRPADADGLRERLAAISTVTSGAIEETRRITHGLRPSQLDRLGLTQAIRALVTRASEDHAIDFACRVEEIDGLLHGDQEIHVYRIVQEAVANVVKHAVASEAAVVIRRRDATITLSIRDNGRGFDVAKAADRPHDLGYGLSGFAERVRILGGSLAIDSRPGAGTSITVELPIGTAAT
jgi:signal transduction histidine kinase